MLHTEGSGGLMRSKIPVLEVSSQPSTQGTTSRARLHSPHLRLPLSKATAAQTGDALTELILTMEGTQSNSEVSRKGGLPQDGKSDSLSPASSLLFTAEPHTQRISHITTGIFWRRLARSLVDDMGMKKGILVEAWKLDL